MAEFSSTLNEEKNINRSDPSRMYNIGQTPLARLRPEKLDDTAIKERILLIQGIVEGIDPDIIALVLHECDYNIQNTIARIKEGNFEDGGWQTAKSNNKKKNHNNNLTEQMLNGSAQSDSERSLSQRTSPTPSLRGGAGGGRRRPEHHQYSSRPNPSRRGNNFDRNSFIPSNSRHSPRKYPSNNKSISTQQNPTNNISSSKQEDITPTPSSTDEYEFIGGTTQSLTFDNSLKKIPVSSSPIKRPTPSSIPQQPVSMHRTIQYSTEPIDIQFGDVQWNDSIPIAVTPSNNPSSPIPHEQQENNLLLNQQTTNEIDIESINSLSITNNTIDNNLPAALLEESSHLSDHLTELSQQQAPSSTPNTSPTNQFLSNTAPGSNSSAFTPYNTPGNFQSRDYPNYKTAPKPTIYPQQPSYHLPPQQQFFVGTYPYHTPALYPVLTSVEPWSTAGYEPYSTYPTTNYIPTYPTPQQYHSVQPTKYDHYPHDKDFFAHYGQTRLSNTESSQSTKDAPTTSKLSATAASFSQGAFVINPVLYTVPAYYQDRSISYPDNRNGASNRNYYHHQQQRTHHNSTWHSQQ